LLSVAGIFYFIFYFLSNIIQYHPKAVGKSSLLRNLRDLKFLEESDSTIGLDVHNHKIATETKKCNAKIWDTSGQSVFRDTIRTQYRGADCILFVFDVSRPETLDQLVPYIKDAQVSGSLTTSCTSIGS
jgi:small GTP-binding protein